MKNFFKKLMFNVKLMWHSLFYGMKSADTLMTNGGKTGETDSPSINQEIGGGGVFKDLLEERVTQEVQEMAYTSYKVASESKKYKYIGNGRARKKTTNQLKEKHIEVDETDNLEPTIIQDNFPIVKTVYDVLTEVDVDTSDKKDVKDGFKLNIVREYKPRFEIEEFTKKIVVKNIDDKESIVDLYCSMYPRQFSRRDNPFIRELKDVMEKGKRVDFLDFQEMSFIAESAFGCDDYMKFSFDNIEFLDIRTFDGNFVVKFKCHNKGDKFGENLLDSIYSESAEEKYRNKEKKQNYIPTISLSEALPKDDYKIPDAINLDNLKNVKLKLD